MGLIDTIRDENVKWYGECVLQPGGPEWGEIFTEKLYSKKTHFLFELIQNAEDACERKRKSTGETGYKLNFSLNEDGLIFRHNGILFNERDIRGICYIARHPDKEDVTQIGKFGIGFKSVYAYTSSPHVYSGEYAFKIENLVLPYELKKDDVIENDVTVFHIPFNHKKVDSETAYREIGKKLRDLELRTLLFLRNVREIVWEIDDETGSYSRECEYKEGHRLITLYRDGKNTEQWLIFEKEIPGDENKRVIEVAYLLEEDGKNQNIVPAKDTELSVYFPTEKETHLHFLIQGPYHTTATRASIEDDDWNTSLIEQTGELVAYSISEIKSLDLLTENYLNVLPLDFEHFSEKDELFAPIYKSVLNTLRSDEQFLPTVNGGYTSPKDAAIARGKPLVKLLSFDQLEKLFNKSAWIDPKITEKGEYTELWDYLTTALGIKIIRPGHLIIKITKEFLEAQTDDWLVDFYVFLNDSGRRTFWESKQFLFNAPGEYGSYDSARVKSIIRLEDNTHVCPFDNNDKPNAFLPPSDEHIRKNIEGFFGNRVKQKIIANNEARSFLKKLGLKEPDAISALYEYILPQYRGPYNQEWKVGEEEEELEKISFEANLRDIGKILKTLDKYSNDSRLKKLINDLQKTEFLYCRNMADGRKYYCSSEDNIYLGEKYIGNKDIELFFEGNDDIWVLEDIYKNEIDVKTLKKFGCKSEINVSYRESQWGRPVIIMDRHSSHKRGLDGFDPNCKIVGLEWALENVTIEKSIIIWGLLRRHYIQIKGTIETATRRDYSNANRKIQYSTMGKMLINKTWLYKEGDNATPQLPSEILLENLSSEYKCPEAQMIADQLELVKPVTEELKEKMDPADRELFEDFEEVKRLGIEDELRELIKKTKELEKMRGEEEKLPDIVNDFKDGLTSGEVPRENGTMNGGWDGATPEEIEGVAENYEVVLEENIEDAELITEPYIGRRSRIRSKGNGKKIEPKEFLRDKYHGGYCQICNTLIDLGNGKKHFVSKRIKPKEHQRKWADEVWNLLCLCPNCYALVSHGRGNDFSNIPVVALSAREGEVVPEMVEERGGDYYIIEIMLAGRKREIFYHPFHLVKLGVLAKKSQEE